MSFSRFIQLLIFLVFLNIDGLGQVCSVQKAKIEFGILYDQGSFKQAKNLIDSIVECAEYTDLERIELHILRYKSQRNRLRNKSASKELYRAEKLMSKNGIETDLNFNSMKMEVFALLGRKDLYEDLMKDIKKTILNGKDTLLIGRYYFSQYMINPNGDAEENQSNLNKALLLFQSLELCDPYYIGHCHRGLGNKARYLGNFEKAIEQYQNELELYTHHYHEDQFDIGVCHFNLGNVYYEMGESRKALDHYLLTEKIWKLHFQEDSSFMLSLYEAIADMYWALEEVEESIEYYEIIGVHSKGKNNDQSEGIIKSADSLMYLNNHELAIERYQSALLWRIQQYGEDHMMTGACQNYLARALHQQNNKNQALEEYQNSIDILVEEMDDSSINENPTLDMNVLSDNYLFEALTGKSEILLDLYEEKGLIEHLEMAFETFDVTIDLMLKINNYHLEEGSRLFWTQKCRNTVELGIECCYQMYEIIGNQEYLISAFHWSEYNKSLVLNSAIDNSRIKSFKDVPNELIEKEHQLKKDIIKYKLLIENEEKRCSEARPKLIDGWKEKLFIAEKDFFLLTDQLRLEYTNYYNLKYSSPIFDYDGFLNGLRKNGQQCVSYFFGKNYLFVFLIKNDKIRLRKVRITTDLTNEFETFIHGLYNNQFDDLDDFLNKSHTIFQRLLGPEYEEVKESNRLLILPDGVIYTIPFDCLVHNTDATSYKNASYLFMTHAISYVQTAQIFNILYENTNEEWTYSGFAPEYKDIDSTFVYPSLNDLTFNKNEIIRSSEYMDGLKYLDKDATESNFKSEITEKSIIHLAAHGMINNEDPLKSAVFLYPDEFNDGVLYAYEIYGLSTPSSLIFLSACETGSGEIIGGEGMMSLERAFQYSGSKGILSSLWNVEDESIGLISEVFFQHLNNGSSIDVSTQKAKLKYLKDCLPDKAHPYYWASIKYTGNPNIEKSDSYWMKWLFGILISFTALVYLRRKFSS